MSAKQSAYLPNTGRSVTFGTRHMVSSPHYMASAAGFAILEQGGSAVDAIITANAVLTVVYNHMSGLGGDVFAQVWDPKTGKVEALNGSGRSGAEATLDFFRAKGVSQIEARGPAVHYSVENRDGQPRQMKKGVIPDSFFMIQETRGRQSRARFLLELDMATHDNPSFGREKVLPGINYILSPQYKARFGDNSGRWLVVTTGERRMSNLKHQAEALAGKAASAFYFTTFDRITAQTVLSQPIWYRGGESEPETLLQ